MARPLAVAAIGLLATVLGAAAAAEVLIVRSTGGAAARYPAGRSAPDNVVIRLNAGETVTVLGGGRTRVFRGPGRFRPSDPVRAAPRNRERQSANRIAGISLSQIDRGGSGGSILIVRSAGPSSRQFRAGTSLPGNSRVTLRPGDTIIVLGSNGTRTFRGPGTFAVNQANGTAFAANSGGQRARLGAVRSSGVDDRFPPSVWHLDVAPSGNFCVADPASLQLWRSDAGRDETIVITGPDGSSRTLTWAAGSATLRWPSALPIETGRQYRIARNGAAAGATITFQLMDSPSADLSAVTTALIRHDCSDQLDTIVATVPATAASGPGESPAEPRHAESADLVIDAGRPGHACFVAGSTASLWRRDAEAAATVTLAVPGAQPLTLAWPEGNDRLAWPSDLALADGTGLTLVEPGRPDVAVTLHRIEAPAEAEPELGLARQLLAKGCQAQLDELIETTLVEEAEPAT